MFGFAAVHGTHGAPNTELRLTGGSRNSISSSNRRAGRIRGTGADRIDGFGNEFDRSVSQADIGAAAVEAGSANAGITSVNPSAGIRRHDC